MAIERTFSILKPDATERNLTGAINAVIEEAGLRIVAQKRMRISREQAERFYAIHRERPFFRELVDFMISGPVVVQVVEGDNAIAKYREVMGATDPAKAATGTIRKLYARSIGENSVHGSERHALFQFAANIGFLWSIPTVHLGQHLDRANLVAPMANAERLILFAFARSSLIFARVRYTYSTACRPISFGSSRLPWFWPF